MILLSLTMLGVLAIMEATIALYLRRSDSTRIQLVRLVRILGGAYLVAVGLLGKIPTLQLSSELFNWNNLVQTAISASISGVAMFVSVRYVGRVVDKIEKNGKASKSKE